MASAAGKRDRRVTIQQGLATRNALGEPVAVWVDMITLWAAFRPLPLSLKASEPFTGQQFAAFAYTEFETLYRRDITITPQLRVLHDGRIYDIVRVNEVGRRKGLKIEAYARAEAA